jgi:ubiquitin-conjugating enzyme E2 A
MSNRTSSSGGDGEDGGSRKRTRGRDDDDDKKKRKKVKSVSKAALLRLARDLKVFEEDRGPDGVCAGLVDDDNLYVWEASIFGPEGSPWEGGVFSISMVFPETYPMKPPLVRFTNEVFHPNVYADGTLCLDILQDAWSPVQSVSSILKSIQSLLTDPNVDSPANTEAANLYKNNRTVYRRRVRRCACRSVE